MLLPPTSVGRVKQSDDPTRVVIPGLVPGIQRSTRSMRSEFAARWIPGMNPAMTRCIGSALTLDPTYDYVDYRHDLRSGYCGAPP